MSQVELIQILDSSCPWCGSKLTVRIDNTTDDLELIEDCEICCAPIVFRVDRDLSGHINGVFAIRENE